MFAPTYGLSRLPAADAGRAEAMVAAAAPAPSSSAAAAAIVRRRPSALMVLLSRLNARDGPPKGRRMTSVASVSGVLCGFSCDGAGQRRRRVASAVRRLETEAG